jgi:hypothetical protein
MKIAAIQVLDREADEGWAREHLNIISLVLHSFLTGNLLSTLLDRKA